MEDKRVREISPASELKIKKEERMLSKKQISISYTNMILSALLLGALLAAGFFYYQFQQQKSLSTGNDQDEIRNIVDRLQKSVELPQDEVPTLAEVTATEKLPDQPFFQKAQVGDKILLYPNNKRAILYRPETKKIIDMTTITIGEEDAVSETNQDFTADKVLAPRTNLSVTLLNVSGKANAVSDVENTVTNNLKDYTVEEKSATVEDDYQGILVIDTTGNNLERASELANTLGGRVESLPSKETADGDLVVIIGN